MSESMNKKDVIDAVSEKAGVTKAVAANAVDAMLEAISESLSKGETVRFIGFGTFSVQNTKERQGRNPQSGEQITIPASNRIKFVTGKTLKDAINDK